MGAVGQRNELEVQRGFETFEGQWPTWAWLRDRLLKSGLEPTSVRELPTKDSRSSWIILAKASLVLVKQFELAPEILVLVTPWDVTQAKDIVRAEEVFRQELRIDPGFALVITRDVQAEKRLGPVIPEKRKYLFLDAAAFEQASNPEMFLRGLLRNALGRRRLFDVRVPASGPQFFGREKELEALERDIRNGQCIGVFGLRKVGKTSLLRRVAEKLRERGDVLPIEVDLQETPYNRRTLDGIVELIGRRLDREVQGTRFYVKHSSTDPQQRLLETIEHVETSLQGRTVLILDEYEVLLAGKMPTNDGVEILTWLRGLAQSHSNSFGVVLAGRNGRLLAPARIEGIDNPMYRFLRKVPLSGLNPEDCRTMVRKIGRRMALDFKHDALDIIVAQTGGHPALARTLGNFVDEYVDITSRNPAGIDAALIEKVLPRFASDLDDDMRELVEASRDFDARAADYLVYIAHAVPWIGGASEERIANALADYGILHGGTNTFRIGQLATWLREQYAPPVKAAHG